LHVGEGEGCGVGGADVFSREPAVGRQVLVVHDSCLEEVDNLLMLTILWPIARDIERGEAGGVFRKFMAPEIAVLATLGDPVSTGKIRQIGILDCKKNFGVE
jgi:hypothetical protein